MTINASWTVADETALINYLAEHIAAAGDGLNFKIATLRGACAEVNKGRTQGGPKTAKGCKQKWSTVRVQTTSALL